MRAVLKVSTLFSLLVLGPTAADAELSWQYQDDGYELSISGKDYSLQLAASATSASQLFSVTTPSGSVTSLQSLFVRAPCPIGNETCEYSLATPSPESELLLLSAGNSLVEAHVTNLRLVSGEDILPAMAQLTIFAHPESLYFKFEVICNQRDWVIQYYNRGNYVYDADPVLSSCHSQDVASVDASFAVDTTNPMAIPSADKTAQQWPLSVSGHYTVMTTAPLSRGYWLFGDEHAWTLSLPYGFDTFISTPIVDGDSDGCVDDRGHQRELDKATYDRAAFGAMLAFGDSSQQLKLVQQQQFPAMLISDAASSYQGFNLFSGRHEFGSHANGQGTAATFEHRVDERYRIQQSLPGAFKGGTQPKQANRPVAIAVQHSLNFDGQGLACHGEVAGVRQLVDFDGGQVFAEMDTFTVDINPDYAPQTAVPDGNSSQYVNLLQPGSEGGVILQTHNNGREANSPRLANGANGEITVTDWRRPFHEAIGATGGPIHKAGATIQFLNYVDANGVDHFLRAIDTDIRSTGPALGEVMIDVESTDGAVVGTISMVSSAEKQIVSNVVPANRLWFAVDLEVVDPVTLEDAPDALSFFSLARRKPLVFRRYAIAEGSAGTVNVDDYSIPTTTADILDLETPGGAMMYAHSNATKQGNSGFVVHSMSLVLNGQPRSSALWVVAEPDSSNDKYRWAKVVTSGVAPGSLQPGDQIRYRLVAFSAGDEDTTAELLANEYTALSTVGVAGNSTSWGSGALVVDASNQTNFDLFGGAGFLPLRFTGLVGGAIYDASALYHASEVSVGLGEFAADTNGELELIMPMDRSSTGELEGVLVREPSARVSIVPAN